MVKSISGKENDPRYVYADIIDHPHWQSPVFPHMSLYDRAAQFSPFAALTGYDDMVSEEARVVDRKIEPGDSEMEQMNQMLRRIADGLARGEHPRVRVTYFVPDPLKSGGRYDTVTENVRQIDTLRGKLVLTRKEGYAGTYAEISLSDILEIHAEHGP